VPGADSVYNDPELTARAVAAVQGALGAQNVVEMPAKMTSEDFCELRPGRHQGDPAARRRGRAGQAGSCAQGRQVPAGHALAAVGAGIQANRGEYHQG
jgi:hypothetical protein